MEEKEGPPELQWKHISCALKDPLHHSTNSTVLEGTYLNELVAIKLLHTDEKSEGQVFRLEHNNIVCYLGVLRNPAAVVSKLAANGRAKDHLPQSNLIQRLRMIKEVAQGLAFLHENRIVHNDVSLRNVVLADECQLCDFEHARKLDPESQGYIVKIGRAHV